MISTENDGACAPSLRQGFLPRSPKTLHAPSQPPSHPCGPDREPIYPPEQRPLLWFLNQPCTTQKIPRTSQNRHACDGRDELVEFSLKSGVAFSGVAPSLNWFISSISQSLSFSNLIFSRRLIHPMSWFFLQPFRSSVRMPFLSLCLIWWSNYGLRVSSTCWLDPRSLKYPKWPH